MPRSNRVPARMRARVDEIVRRTDAIAAAHLDDEYAGLAREMAATLSRGRPSPLERGEARTWAAGILYAVGWVNFLSDPSQKPHMTATDLAKAAGVGESTIAAAFRTIRDTLDLSRMDPRWTRPSRLLDNPIVWLVLVDGIPVDLREAPRALQEQALEEGIIPFKPEAGGFADFAADTEEPGDLDDEDSVVATNGPIDGNLKAELEALVQETLASQPNASIEELNAALQQAAARYNQRPQEELGGLSPELVHRLLSADWEGETSAIRLDKSVPLSELESSHKLQDGRLILTMLGEHGTVKATPKGNLPRAFVTEFRTRMHPRDPYPTDFAWEPRVFNASTWDTSTEWGPHRRSSRPSAIRCPNSRVRRMNFICPRS